MATPTDDFSRTMLASVPRLRALALRLSRNGALADDLVQETLERAWRHHAQFVSGTNQGAWLSTILRNCFLSHLRKDRRHVDCDDDAMAPEQLSPGRQEISLVLKDVVREIDALPDHQRRVVLMVALGDGSHADVAAALDCTVGTVKSRLSRARARLKTALPDGTC